MRGPLLIACQHVIDITGYVHGITPPPCPTFLLVVDKNPACSVTPQPGNTVIMRGMITTFYKYCCQNVSLVFQEEKIHKTLHSAVCVR